MTADGVRCVRSAKAMLASLFCAWSFGWPAVAVADEGSEIAAQRAAVQARYVEREQACKVRFAVTACIDAAKRERRTALDALRSRQLALDQRRRQDRADTRRRELAEKAADDAQRERSTAPAVMTTHPTPASVTPQAPSASRPDRIASPEKVTRAPKAPAKPATPRKTKPVEPAASRAARERAHRQSHDEKQRAVRQHREQSIDATLRRLSEKPPASSLPLPASASGARPDGR